MRFDIPNPKLKRLVTDARYTHRLGPEVVKAYRKAVNFIDKCVDERDLRAIRGYRFKQLEGSRSHQWSLRLNDQWRLIVEFRRDEDGKVIVIIDIEDYHD